MESIQKDILNLREKLQSAKMPLRNHYWGYNWLYRKPSIYITYMLSKTRISANTVSLLVLIFGLIAAWLAFLGQFYYAILFAYLNILFDGVDGEIARLRNVFSLRGAYLDAINHLAIPALFMIALGLKLNVQLAFPAALAWSLLKSVGKVENKIFFGTYLGNEEKFK